MKKTNILICFMLLIIILPACSPAPIDVSPFWSEQDIKNTEEKTKSMPGIVMRHNVTLNMRPDFYKGSMPLEFESISKGFPGGGMMGFSITLIHDFGDWDNLFIYDSSGPMPDIPSGAVAIRKKDRQLMAESRFVRFEKNERGMSDMVIEEIHYDKNGEYPIFYSTFTVNFSEGFKKDEKNVKGKKRQDYFFLWPGGMGSIF